MRVVIVGPGALGSFLAGFLSKNAQVILLDKDARRAERISKSGINCEGVSGKWSAKISATAHPSEIGSADLIIICTKAYDTKEAVLRAKPLVAKDTVILTLQNGLGNADIISEVLGGADILAGVTHHGVTLLGEGSIVHAGSGETVIGSIDGEIPVAVRQIREVFNKSNIETRVSRDIKSIIWSKLVINTGINALGAITRLKNGELVELETTAEILRAAVTEAVRVAKKKRIKLIYDDPIAKVESVCEATAGNICSMLQDVTRKKKTEIDFINGVIVRQGRSAGIPTPINSLLVNLVKAIESSYSKAVG